MIEDLTQRIIQFLKNDTNYALLIKGKSGIGKSYYVKNKLFPIVRETLVSTATGDEKLYPVFISLYGLKSMEAIKEQLFFELAPLLKHKDLTTTADIKTFLAKVSSKNKSAATTTKLFICFDDCNRTSDALQSKELFGFINTILENTNVKILLVETEGKLTKASPDFLLMRETIIGSVLKFQNNVALAYQDIITTKYKEQSPSYFDFLQQRSQELVSKIEANDRNLRTLIFFLQRYESLFTTIQDILRTHEKPALSAAAYFDRTFNYALSVAIEFKMGSLTPSVIFYVKHRDDAHYLENYPLFRKDPLFDKLTQEESEIYDEITSYKKNFEERYLQNIQYQPIASFDSIFEYIVGYASSICEKQLANELKPYEVVENYPLFNPLFNVDVLNLSPSEIDKLIDEMLNLVDQAAFHLSEYTHVFKVVNRFYYTKTRIKPLLEHEEDEYDYMVKKVPSNLIKRFKNGIDTWKSKYNPVAYPEFDVHLGESGIDSFPLDKLYPRNPFKDEDPYISNLEFNEGSEESTREIAMYCQEVFRDIKAQNETHQVTLLRELYEKDMMAFVEKMNDPTTSLKFYPVYAKFDFKEFLAVFRKATNAQLATFGLHLQQRYTIAQDDYHIQILSAEKSFFLSLREKLHQEIEKFENPLFSDFDEIVIRSLLKEVSNVLRILNKK